MKKLTFRLFVIPIALLLLSCGGKAVTEEKIKIDIIVPWAQHHYRSLEEFEIQVAVTSTSADLKSYTYEIFLNRWPGYYEEVSGSLSGKQDSITNKFFSYKTSTEKGFGFNVIVEDVDGNIVEELTSFRVSER